MTELVIVPLNQKISYEASKWLKVQALLDKEEFASLIKEANAFLYGMEGEADKAIEQYGSYVEALKKGEIPKHAPLAWYWTKTLDALYLLDTGHGLQVRVQKPVVQISHHQMNYTPEDNSFRSNLYGPDTIFWGLQFSFPQLFEDPSTKEALKVQDKQLFPNVELFKFLQKWLRQHTIPTPFETVNAPQRIGKLALLWAHHHPQLLKKGLKLRVNSRA